MSTRDSTKVILPSTTQPINPLILSRAATLVQCHCHPCHPFLLSKRSPNVVVMRQLRKCLVVATVLWLCTLLMGIARPSLSSYWQPAAVISEKVLHNDRYSLIYSSSDVFVSQSNPYVYVNVSSQCHGESYEAFADTLHEYASQVARNETLRSSAWGQLVSTTLPSHSNLLVVGNVYTRQVLHSLLGQQPTVPNEVEHLEQRYAHLYTFSNHARVWDVTGTYIWYSPKWQNFLEQQIRFSLQNVDGLILGAIEPHCRSPTHKLRYSLNESTALDCEKYAAPTIDEWLRVLPAHVPIVYVSSFTPSYAPDTQAQRAIQSHNNQHETGSHVTKRTVYINARKHMEALGLEGIVDAGIVVNDRTRGMRCVGARGGWPDVTAWDVMQHLYDYWKSQAYEFRAVLPSSNNDFYTFSLPPNFPRVCRSAEIVVPNNPPTRSRLVADRVDNDDDDDVADELLALNIQYQCQGPRYLGFGERLKSYITHNMTFSSPATLLPPRRRLLIWGNSHTRQVGRSLVCQYADQLTSVNLWPTELARVRETVTGAEVYEFSNGAMATIVSNSYTPYSAQWAPLLEHELQGQSLHDFDAIVVGLFNKCGDNHTFSTDLEQLSAIMPEVDCIHNPPPSIQEIVQEAAGRPVIFVSMFDTTRQGEGLAVIRHVQELADEGQPAYSVDTRSIVESISFPLCLSSKRFSVTGCRREADPLGEGVILHACTGRHGGYADVVGWQILERLWGLWGKEKERLR